MTDGEPKTVVSASLQKIKSITPPPPPPHRFFYFFISFFLNFIKPETSDSVVDHFDGHILKNLGLLKDKSKVRGDF